MEAGRELDKLIAARILGYALDGVAMAPSDYNMRPPFEPWSPSTNIRTAWEVMERLRELGWLVFIGPAADNGPGWSVEIKRRSENLHHHLIAATAPLAICHAALYTLGVEV